MLSARFELAIFRVSGERIDQLSHESQPGCLVVNMSENVQHKLIYNGKPKILFPQPKRCSTPLH